LLPVDAEVCEKCAKPTPKVGGGDGRPAGEECGCPRCVICFDLLVHEVDEVQTLPGCLHVSCLA
jgi:hypothetical protein